MKIKYLCYTVLFLAIATNSGCKEKANQLEVLENTDSLAQEDTEYILVGKQPISELLKEPHTNWFTPTYATYEIDMEALKDAENELTDSDITIFMGTWCEDSQREVPAFMKILDSLNFDKEHLTLITVSRDKDTPTGLEDGKDLINVPTFIFYRDGQELGRIVEYPIESLEKDMSKILNGEPYEHAYAEN